MCKHKLISFNMSYYWPFNEVSIVLGLYTGQLPSFKSTPRFFNILKSGRYPVIANTKSFLIVSKPAGVLISISCSRIAINSLGTYRTGHSYRPCANNQHVVFLHHFKLSLLCLGRHNLSFPVSYF